jgi:hypothetical protein
MTPAQKQQFKNTYASQIRQKSTAYAAANANTSTGSTGSTGTGYNPGTAKSAAETMRDYNARQQVFKMMNDMSLNNHALSLNIIENIGGTGNYWSVVDY